MKRPLPRCTYCGQALFRSPGRRSTLATCNRFTRDHIVPRAWRAPLPPEVRTTRPACQHCNQLRAMLGHCPAMIPIARAIGQRRQICSAREVVRIIFPDLHTRHAKEATRG